MVVKYNRENIPAFVPVPNSKPLVTGMDADTSKRDAIWLEKDVMVPLAGTNSAFVYQGYIFP